MEAVEGRTGRAWRTDHGKVKMRNLKFFIISVEEKNGQEESTARRTPNNGSAHKDVWWDLWLQKKLRWWRDAALRTWAEEKTAVVFWPETKKRRVMCLHFNATNNGYVSTDIISLKTYSILPGLLGPLPWSPVVILEWKSVAIKRTQSRLVEPKDWGADGAWGTTRTQYSTGERKSAPLISLAHTSNG